MGNELTRAIGWQGQGRGQQENEMKKRKRNFQKFVTKKTVGIIQQMSYQLYAGCRMNRTTMLYRLSVSITLKTSIQRSLLDTRQTFLSIIHRCFFSLKAIRTATALSYIRVTRQKNKKMKKKKRTTTTKQTDLSVYPWARYLQARCSGSSPSSRRPPHPTKQTLSTAQP